jgi:uncharacterized phage-associated protein
MTLSAEIEKTSIAIITLHRELFGESPSPMKLQKLCYYAQGFALAENKTLFPEDFQAWQHGPVIPDLYDKYKHYQWRQITDEAAAGHHEHIDFLRDIVHAYGRYDGAALSTMTHRESPWLDARGELDESEGSTTVIPKSSLSACFRQKLNAHG